MLSVENISSKYSHLVVLMESEGLPQSGFSESGHPQFSVENSSGNVCVVLQYSLTGLPTFTTQVDPLHPHGCILSVLLTFLCVKENRAILSSNVRSFEIDSISISSQISINYLLVYVKACVAPILASYIVY